MRIQVGTGEMYQCDKCGAMIKDIDNFCWSCGMKKTEATGGIIYTTWCPCCVIQ